MVILLRKKRSWLLYGFLCIEALLFAMILTTHGKLLVWSEFISIVLCCLFAAVHCSKANGWMGFGLVMTVCADLCLVVWQPMQQLWGMVFFLLAQCCYAIMLHRQRIRKHWLYIRIGLILLVEGIAVLVLRDKTDPLALVSMCYYVNLILNLVCACVNFRENKLLAIGFVLFLLCDTVIGLQMAAGVYLPIAEGSLVYRIIFMDFHLSWFFYLPSQVLIACTCRNKMLKG